MEAVRNELVTAVIDHAESTLKQAGIDAKKASQIAVMVADNLVDLFGGQNITFPTEHGRKIAEKEALIYSQFNGSNSGALAKAHGMTDRGIRKLLARVRSRNAKQSGVVKA
jgi:Mor family transcriptional regulator